MELCEQPAGGDQRWLWLPHRPLHAEPGDLGLRPALQRAVLGSGRPVLAVSLVWMALLFGRGIATVGYSGMILTGLQLVPFLAVIPATERALKREFDAVSYTHLRAHET